MYIVGDACQPWDLVALEVGVWTFIQLPSINKKGGWQFMRYLTLSTHAPEGCGSLLVLVAEATVSGTWL